MAIEKVLFSIKQDHMVRASELSKEGSQLLLNGKRDEAEEKLGEVKAELDKTKAIDNLLPKWLSELKKAGIEQPSAEYLQKFISQPKKEIEVSVAPIPTFLTPIPPEEVKEERTRGDLAPRENKLAYALLKVNDERNGFANISWREVSADAYSDVLETVTDEQERKAKIDMQRNSAMSIAKIIVKKLEDAQAQPEIVRTNIKNLMDWVRSQPEYATLSMDTLRLMLRRKITFDEVLSKPQPTTEEEKEINPVLTKQEVFQLAQTIKSASDVDLEESGIKLHPEDKSEVTSIVEKLSSDKDIDKKTHQDKEPLKKKLLANMKDPKGVLLANSSNEDAQFLLTFLRHVDSEEKLGKLMPSDKSTGKPEPK